MHKILRKRVRRDLKKNWFRYLLLASLIIVGLFMVISMAGAADTVINRTDEMAKKLKTEDGEFTVFVPLSQSELDGLREGKILVEKKFSFDVTMQDKSVLRVFNNRKQINRVHYISGHEAEKNDEVALEKLYAKQHHLTVGNHLKIGGRNFKIVGIVSAVDYDAPYNKLSDFSVDSKSFGILFVPSATYDWMRENTSHDVEEYCYSYYLSDKMSDKQFKDKVKKLKYDPESVKDKWFQEYYKESLQDVEDLKSGMRKLSNGTRKLSDALGEIRSNNTTLNKGAHSIFLANLRQANYGLRDAGFSVKLTEKNYKKSLKQLAKKQTDSMVKSEINSVLEQLVSLDEYQKGVESYTNGIEKSRDASDKLASSMWEAKNKSVDMADEMVGDAYRNMTNFMSVQDNIRVGAAAEDQKITKLSSLVAGIIVLVLFAYVISVFVVHGIEKEKPVIGTLYALGITKKELLIHYLTLPVIVTWIGGILGTLIGYSEMSIQMQLEECYGYFSVPSYQIWYSPYLLVYGFVIPPVITFLVNYILISKKLQAPALSLIRNEEKEKKTLKIPIHHFSYMTRFQIRQMMRESRSAIAVVLGMLVSLMIFMIGFNCYFGCKYVSDHCKSDTKYAYMYQYKYPTKKIPSGGEACFAKTMKKEVLGQKLDVTLLGIERENPYFKAKVKKGKSHICVSSSMALKYNLKQGELLVLDDEEKNKYAFTIDEITPYGTGLYAFMDISSMRKLMGEQEDYYNMVLSSKKLQIPSGRLYSTVTKQAITKGGSVFMERMGTFVMTMIIASAFVFVIVMYLMMKVMVERSTIPISLVKVLGYNKKEVKKLYLNGNFLVIAIGALVCIALSKLFINAIYPYLVSNVVCGMDVSAPIWSYVVIYLSILLLYQGINWLLVCEMNKISPMEVLKNRE